MKAETARRDAPPKPGSVELAEIVAEIGEGAFQRELEGRAPFDAFEIVRRTKVGALRVPVELGGSGSSLRELFAFAIDIGAADPNTAQALRNHYAFLEMWLRSTDAEGRERWLREAARGTMIGLLGTELGSAALGSRQFSTTLVRDGDGYVMNGTKYYSTGAMFSDWIGVTVQNEEGDIVTALVPAGQDGVTFEDDWDGMGQRLTASGTTRLENVRVARGDVMTQAVALSGQSTFFQLWLTAVIAGILQAVVDDSVAVLRRRTRTFLHAAAGEPVDDPLLQTVVGQISSDAFAARAIVMAAAEPLELLADPSLTADAEESARHEAAFAAAKAKVVIDEMAVRTAGLIFDVGGASATRQIYNLDRHWRNIRTLASHNPGLYKARAIGEREINGSPPPASGFF